MNIHAISIWAKEKNVTSSPKVPSHLLPVNPPTRITATLTSDPMGSFGLILSLLEMESEAVFLCVWLFFFLLNNLSVRWSHVPSGHCWFSFSTLCDTLLLTLCNVVLHSMIEGHCSIQTVVLGTFLCVSLVELCGEGVSLEFVPKSG